MTHKLKLSLHRETLRRLSSSDLGRIGAADGDAGAATLQAEFTRPPCPIFPTQPPICRPIG